MKTIELTLGFTTMIDDEDHAAVVTAGPWCASVKRREDGSIHGVYAVRRAGGIVYLQNFLMGVSAPSNGVEVDYISADTLDNRRANLRIATHQHNIWSQRLHSNNTSGLKGVTWDKDRGLWVAQITVNGHHNFLGRFTDEFEAGHAYDFAALAFFGAFAMTNDSLGLLAESDTSSIRPPVSYPESQESQPQRLEKRSSENTSGLRGVSWNTRQQQWIAQMMQGGVKIHLGGFTDKLAAKRAYDLAALVFAVVSAA